MKKKPKHIGIIPDGNRRWAVEHGMRKQDGYEYGLLPGLKLLRQAKENNVEEITYYGFTVDNCKRPKEQFEAFQAVCIQAVDLLTKEGADSPRPTVCPGGVYRTRPTLRTRSSGILHRISHWADKEKSCLYSKQLKL